MLKISLSSTNHNDIHKFFEDVEKSLKNCKRQGKKQAILIQGDSLKII